MRTIRDPSADSTALIDAERLRRVKRAAAVAFRAKSNAELAAEGRYRVSPRSILLHASVGRRVERGRVSYLVSDFVALGIVVVAVVIVVQLVISRTLLCCALSLVVGRSLSPPAGQSGCRAGRQLANEQASKQASEQLMKEWFRNPVLLTGRDRGSSDHDAVIISDET